MKLAVLGTGCAKCHSLEDTVRKKADALGLDYTLETVRDLPTIASYGVMMTPALVVDGQVRLAGKLPSDKELTRILTDAG